MPIRISLLLALLLGAGLPLSSVTSLQAAERVLFQRQAPEPGDASAQRISFQLRLKMAIRQAGQVVDAKAQHYQKRQHRLVRVVDTQGTEATEAQLVYRQSESVVAGEQEPEQRIEHPVHGKAYRIRRLDGQLQVTDPQGQVPPAEQLAQVQHDMQQFGLPNPLSAFFAGKRVEVGQTVEVPTELAAQLLGPEDQLGKVTRFQMRLDAVTGSSEQPTAQFSTVMAIQPVDEQGMHVQVQGKVGLDVHSSRLTTIELTGPVELEETFGPENAPFAVVTSGTIQVRAEVAPFAPPGQVPQQARRPTNNQTR